VPAYWERMDPNLPIMENLRRNILPAHAWTIDESRILLQDFITDLHNYVGIMRAIADGQLAISEISERTGLTSSKASFYLSVLRDTGFVSRRVPVSQLGIDSRRGRYFVTDPYLRFFYRFMSAYQSKLALGQNQQLLEMIEEELPEFMPRARYFGISFLDDLSGFYYSKFTEIGSRIYFHKMGSSFDDDRLVFGEGYDPGKIIYAGLSEDGKYVFVTVLYGSASDKTEVYVKEVGSKRDFIPVVNDLDARFFVLNERDEELFVLTNFQAPRYRILRVGIEQLPSRPETWKELIPERDRKDVFTALEKNLNRFSKNTGMLELEIPIACIVGEK